MKIKKKYIIIGLVILLLIISGAIFFFWKKSKNQNNSSTEDDEDNEDELPPNEEKEELKYSDYLPPLPSESISEAEAQQEALKTLNKWIKRDAKEIEKLLPDVISQMDYQEDKKLLNKNLKWEEVEEKLMQKYKKDIFLAFPSSQTKFGKKLEEGRLRNHLLGWNLFFKRKNNGEVDWKKTLKWMALEKGAREGIEKLSKSQAEKRYRELEGLIKKNNSFLVKHGKQFEKITNLAELNQWSIIQAQKLQLSIALEYLWYCAATTAGRKTYGSEVLLPKKVKNKKFDLTHKITIFAFETRD